MHEHHVVIFRQRSHDRASRPPGAGDVCRWLGGRYTADRRDPDLAAELAEARPNPRKAPRRSRPSGGDQGFELALPNPCVFGVMDHSYDEGRIRTGCTALSLA